tara:strand:+ start:3359 stop:3889 length:531 start_codon:yes stop_codon:yes gene_type:complete
MTHKQLLELIRQKPGTTFVGADIHCDAAFYKTDCPFKAITKKYKVSLLTGANYKRMIEKLFGKEDFPVGPLPKGREWIIRDKVLRFVKRDILGLRTFTSPRMRKHVPDVTYFDENGVEIARRVVDQYLKKPTPSKKQEDFVGEEQLNRDQIWVRDYGFDSIVRLRTNQQEFEIIPG